ncbi:MAG: hypothetical protein KBF93_07225 [Leptospiraceae bacterium]|nr:hypothetical protein [Leptospiraceae bacterium]
MVKLLQITFFVFLFLNCASGETKDELVLEDTAYQIKFSPCICKRQDMIVQAKKTILSQGIKDYEEFAAKVVEPELKSEIIDEQYEHFLYDFSLDEKSKDNLSDFENTITADGKVKQQKLDQFVETNSKNNRHKPNTYGSKGLEVIKGFQSDRKKHQTIGEISKSKNPTILLYEIKRR